MTLKDLIVDPGGETEKAIEEIISAYVRFEIDPPDIVFTPRGNALGNAEKVIVYFSAVLGWRYVVDEPLAVITKPAELEDALGIYGSTLRNVLKRLKDNHILAVADGHYSIRASNLAEAARLVSGQKRLGASAVKSRRTGGSSAKAAGNARNSAKSKRKAGMPIKASLEALLGEGFFGESRTLKQIVERLHELAVNAKMTSLSGPVAALVRENKLERKKANKSGKRVWTYSAPRG